jgi:hypothetical protein
VLAAGLFAWTLLVGWLHPAHPGDLMDDGLYLVGAQALSAGQGYTLPSRIGPQVRPRYPVGLSAVVGVALKLAPGSPSLGRDVAVARTVIIASGWVFVLGTCVALRRLGVATWPAVWIALATAFHPATLRSAVGIVTDLPFAAVAVVAYGFWARRGAFTLGRGLGDGILAGAALALRGNGISILLGAVADMRHEGWRKEERGVWVKALGLGVGLFVVLIPAHWLANWGNGGRVAGGYLKELAEGWSSLGVGLHLVALNLALMARLLPEVALPQLMTRAASAWPVVNTALGGALLALMVFGASRLARRTLRSGGAGSPVWTHVIATLAIFVVWPWDFRLRFVLSLVPLVLLATSEGVVGVARRVGARPLAAHRLASFALALMLVAALVASGYIAWIARRTGGALVDPIEQRDLTAALAFIRERLEPDAAVVSMTPELVYLHTARRGMLLAEERDVIRKDMARSRDRVARQMAEAPRLAFYLMIPRDPGRADPDGDVLDFFDPARGFSLSAREVFRSLADHYRLYRVERGAEADR